LSDRDIVSSSERSPACQLYDTCDALSKITATIHFYVTLGNFLSKNFFFKARLGPSQTLTYWENGLANAVRQRCRGR
jgi:hypothetical protein